MSGFQRHRRAGLVLSTFLLSTLFLTLGCASRGRVSPRPVPGLESARPQAETPAPTEVRATTPETPKAEGPPAFRDARIDYAPVDVMPELISIPNPDYPPDAIKSDTEGTVKVRALIGLTGTVQEAIAFEGPVMLRAASIRAARAALFKPAMYKGKPVEVWVQIPMKFSLH